MDSSQPQPCGICGSWWRLPLLLSLVLAAIVWSRGRALHNEEGDNKNQPDSTAAATPAEKVSLTVDFGDGRRKNFDAIAWRDGMTVADMFNRGLDVATTQKGSGESAFITTIDGRANEGTAGRNWIYSVNGKIAECSCAIYRLQPGDRVLWEFGAQR